MWRRWRWRLCIVSWLACVYVCILVFTSIINLADYGLHPQELPARNMPAANIQQQNRPWGVSINRGGRILRVPWCKPLNWRIPAGPNTALVSFPGSGNTWLRYLLQQVSGILTGSVYKDYALLKNGFPAESVCNGSVLVVKTHEWGPKMRSNFKRVILVIRDPYESILAEFNRQSGGHIGHASPDKFKRDEGKYWETFALNKAKSWMNTTLDWLQFRGPLMVVYYEHLVKNLSTEMKGILEFLELPVTDEEFQCMMKYKDGIYRRKKKELPFKPFNQHLQKVIQAYKHAVDLAVQNHFKADTFLHANSSHNVSFIRRKLVKL